MLRNPGLCLLLVLAVSTIQVQGRKPRGLQNKLDNINNENHKHNKASQKDNLVDAQSDSDASEGGDGRAYMARPMRCPAPCPQSCSSQGCTPGCCAANMPVAPYDPCSQQPGGCGQMLIPVQMQMMPCTQPGGCAPQIQMPYPMPLPMPAPCTQPGGCMPQYQMQMPVPCIPPACIPGMGMAYMPAPPPPMQFTVQMTKPQVFQLPLPQAPMMMAPQTYQQANCNPACATSCQASCPKTTCCGPLPRIQAPVSCPQQCAQYCAPECPHSCCGGYQSQMMMPQPIMMPMPLQVQMLPPILTQLPQQCAPQCQQSCPPMCPRACCGFGKRRR